MDLFNKYKSKFNEEFLNILYENITSIFEENINANDLHNLVGTNGFVTAFESTCNSYKLWTLKIKYEKLDWYESDEFDSLVLEFLEKHVEK